MISLFLFGHLITACVDVKMMQFRLEMEFLHSWPVSGCIRFMWSFHLCQVCILMFCLFSSIPLTCMSYYNSRLGLWDLRLIVDRITVDILEGEHDHSCYMLKIYLKPCFINLPVMFVGC